MSTSPLRSAMVPITRQMRAYFAPVNRITETPTIFDPAAQRGCLRSDSPPAPWVDLGWIESFERFYDTPTDVVRSGANDAARDAVSRADRGESGVRFPGMGQAADGAGGRVGAHECAGDQSERDAGAFGWNADSGRSAVLAGSTASQLVVGSGRGERDLRWEPDCSGRGLSAADWICGLGDFGGICEQSGGRE